MGRARDRPTLSSRLFPGALRQSWQLYSRTLRSLALNSTVIGVLCLFALGHRIFTRRGDSTTDPVPQGTGCNAQRVEKEVGSSMVRDINVGKIERDEDAGGGVRGAWGLSC